MIRSTLRRAGFSSGRFDSLIRMTTTPSVASLWPAIAFVAEVSSLVGAAWRQSPALASGPTDVFAFPAVRRWLSFTSEAAFARSLAADA